MKNNKAKQEIKHSDDYHEKKGQNSGDLNNKVNMNPPTKQRDYMFDNVKAILIYLVVVGHLIDTYHVPSKLYTVVYYFIYFFHMPAFIFITGYFSKNLNKCRETAFEKFFIPYIILNISLFLQYRVMFGGNNSFRVFHAPLGGWFLLTVFIWRILLKDLVRIRFILPLIFIFGIVSGISREFTLYMSLGRMAALTCFFLLGYFTTAKHVEIIRKIPKIVSIISLGAIIWLAYYYVMGDIMPKGPILFRKPYRINAISEDMNYRMILYGVAIIMIGVLLNLTTNKKNIFTSIGSKTLTVYVVHLFIIQVIDEYVFFQNSPILYGVYIFLGAAAITYLCSRQIVMDLYDGFMGMVCRLVLKDNKE